MFIRHFAAWETAEKVRMDRAEKNKRGIWKDQFPKKRQELREYRQMNATQITKEQLQAVRAVFDWLRGRVAAAKQTLQE
jgi:hypothetical protein